MAATYIPIATQTISSPSATVTFSSIPSTYTDLVLVASLRQTTTNQDGFLRFNSDTGTNYSDVVVRGNGSTASSVRDTSAAGIDIGVMSNSANASGEFETVIINIMNYANTTTNKTVVLRTNQPTSIVNAIVGMWRSTAAINTVSLESRNAGSFAVGSTFSLYGIASASVGAKATGGVISSDANYWYHTFTSSGTFTPNQALTCDYLVIAGGGGGGFGSATGVAGGGGAGGLRSTVTATGGGGALESALALASGTGYTVTIGAGGSGSSTDGAVGSNGSNSVFSTITSTGGGGGGSFNFTYKNAASGGSGGGGATYSGGGTAGAGTANQGFAGGIGNEGAVAAGGGGGAGAVGAAGTTSQGGNGGAGVTTIISGISTTYAGGGGGVVRSGTQGVGGAGGGGTAIYGGSGNGGAGTANTGSGGGGKGNSTGGTGGNGGSGLVIVRYPI